MQLVSARVARVARVANGDAKLMVDGALGSQYVFSS